MLELKLLFILGLELKSNIDFSTEIVSKNVKIDKICPKKTSTILNILGADSIPLSDTGVGLLKAGTHLGEGKSPFPRIVSI